MSISSWEGYVVSINCCEPLGCYQGTIKVADSQTITLTKAFRNGFPYPKPEVTLNAADIRDIQIINIPGEASQREHSTVEVTRNKKSHRSTVCESLQATPSASSGQQSAKGAKPTPSKPIEIQGGSRIRHNSQSAGGSQPRAGAGQPRARGDKARKRNEACFGGDEQYADDFDFEGNLALFDKRALWHEMRNAHRPDLVRQADEALRHDENVLSGGGGTQRCVRVPDEARGAAQYTSDAGVVVPSVSARVRRALWAAMHAHGLSEAADTLLARAAADVCLRLTGGGRRLDPRNAHQAPTAVALVGAHRGGARGLRALRLLASHGVHAEALVAGAAPPPPALRRELAAARLAGVVLAETPAQLPRADVLLLALYDVQLDDAEAPAHEAALKWARSARGVIVALEPPASGWPSVTARATVLGLLPPALSPSLGHLYLANVAPPPRLMQDLGIDYRSPFCASSAISLCLTEDA